MRICTCHVPAHNLLHMSGSNILSFSCGSGTDSHEGLSSSLLSPSQPPPVLLGVALPPTLPFTPSLYLPVGHYALSCNLHNL